MGDHGPRHLEAAGQTVYAGGGLCGNPDYPIKRYIDPILDTLNLSINPDYPITIKIHRAYAVIRIILF